MAVDVKQPLLEKKKEPAILLYPNCCACKNSYLLHEDAKPPLKIFAVMAVLTLVNMLPISSLYPFLYFMVSDFDIAKSDKDIGFFAGSIGPAFMIGRFLTSVHWGMAAGKYGRVPVMMIGIIFAYASEICNEKNQAISVSIVGTIWDLGLIIGPAIGGYFAQPAVKYPNLFPLGSLFDRYPYLLPSLLVAVVAVPTLYVTFYLPETMHTHDTVEVEKIEDAKDEHTVSLSKDLSGTDTANGIQEYNQVASISSDEEKILPVISVSDLNHDVKKKSMFSNKPLMGSIALYCVWSYVEGGHLSLINESSEGFCMLLFQIFAYVPMVNLLGAVLVSQVSAASTVLLMFAYPFTAMLQGEILWVALTLLSIIKCFFGVSIFTASFSLVNYSVTRDQRGAANGLTMSFVSLFKAVGPAGGGSIFAWGQSRQSLILPGNQLVLFAVGGCCFRISHMYSRTHLAKVS